MDIFKVVLSNDYESYEWHYFTTFDEAWKCAKALERKYEIDRTDFYGDRVNVIREKVFDKFDEEILK